ncbi:MAG: SEC-C domain-containing protein [Syntrophobacterales bacterium]|nr:SEC-C domain-containing protein [Syntrophobacterales bacterium]HNQ01449.1 SEC-C metal-binding domain-containing protein [Syntrophales bacterium]HNS53644.1 SEC-C metal-binding domain-containing protein [Syntrophales bacterium]
MKFLEKLFSPEKSPAKKPETGRNDACPCGSGKKYKRCCLDSDEKKRRKQMGLM